MRVATDKDKDCLVLPSEPLPGPNREEAQRATLHHDSRTPRTRSEVVNMRSTSGFQSTGASGHSPLLLGRVSEKKLELENLRELRDLSAQLASQMEMLETKLSTLANGTEGVTLFSVMLFRG